MGQWTEAAVQILSRHRAGQEQRKEGNEEEEEGEKEGRKKDLGKKRREGSGEGDGEERGEGEEGGGGDAHGLSFEQRRMVRLNADIEVAMRQSSTRLSGENGQPSYPLCV